MDAVISENGLQEELEDRLVQETGNTNFWLDEDSSLDEPSDTEDPEDTLRTTVTGLRGSCRPKHNGPGCARRAGMSQAAKGPGARSHGA